MVEEKYYKRFTLEARLQHIILLITFLTLVITGFTLKYSDSWWAQTVVNAIGGWEMRAHIHHIAGITMVGIGLYHFLRYVLFRRTAKAMLPRFRDLVDFWGYIKHHFGASEFPKYDRFEWKQKFEYWGVVWGVILMGITGFMLMFPFVTLQYIPYAWLRLAAVMHFYEALLATLVVFIWHFYNVHLNFEFPMQTSFITGKISEEMLKKEHRLEYERTVVEDQK
jgi:formate dehydrogenase gamma subunit